MRILAVIIAMLSILGCSEPSDQEIHAKFENVLGHDIPEKFRVTLRYKQPWLRIDDIWKYDIAYESKEFGELMENIDTTKWKKSGEVLIFRTEEHPNVRLQIIPRTRILMYAYIVH